MIYTILKLIYTKSGPKIIREINYTNFWEESFHGDLKQIFKNGAIFSNLNDNFTKTFDIHIPVKKLWKD